MRKYFSLIGLLFAFFLPTLALAAQDQVSLGVNSISPSTIDINAGDTVVWTNTSSATQSVTSDNGAFQSGSIAPGGAFAATFNTGGTYNYYDNAGGNTIVGEVVVGGASVSTPTVYVNPNATYTTTGSSNSTLGSLESELQALLGQISALEGGSSSSGVSGSPTYTSGYTSGGSCPQIGRVLSLGTSGSDVTSLQEFLGVSPATGYYGTLTQSAVESWQAANNIISYGTPSTTGYGVVGPRTAAAIRLSCSGGSATAVSGATGSGVVSGFLQVSPVSGSAPLVVTVTATVNTAASCTGATYTLSFGDGTQNATIPLTAGNCSQQNESFQHTYQYGGTYTITLSSGAHSSTATVTVSGASGPSTAVTAAPDETQASGSMTAFVTSGPAPLSTTFYVSCAAGLAYDVVFGDGTDLGSNGVSQSSCNGGLQSVAHTYTSIGSYNAQLVVFIRNSQGTISSQGAAEQGITVTGSTTSSSSSSSTSSSTSTSSTYQPPTLTPDIGGNPLEVTLQYNYDSSGCEVSIQWGDGTSTGGSSCTTLTGQSQTYTQSHTYTQSGNYTVTLDRASQTNTVGVSISD